MINHIHPHDPQREELYICNQSCSARISLYGGQILQWQPHNTAEVLWLSPLANFSNGAAIRGGIPLCWPWFGKNTKQPALPSHGLARTAMWKLVSSDCSDAQTSKLELALDLPEQQLAARLQLSIGSSLKMTLTSNNHSAQSYELSEALHTYFNISRVDSVSVEGLQQASYAEFAVNADVVQDQPLILGSACDRIYTHAQDSHKLQIKDPGFARSININSRNSRNTIVWNPGSLAESMSDVGMLNQPGFICVESGNVRDNAVQLPAGGTHAIELEISVEPLSL